ncbi:hypothetical protein QWJ34_20695 [Saccharibacillus sp. CPCC 101409]|uniref:hypothetical protein n=1 Tax=Saccharibacillus sp. CPCC 101409 TaxID=3058041 RepID=UPI002670D47E|nr:hypothetical protein [Saccharibacillus sp. CPCC 101409]MDO3412194.1 hypothetical protein [Saccharibacillus sp. CPCC 101409]
MSEFTWGHLILNRDLDKVEAFRPVKVKTLNDKWSVFFTPESRIGDDRTAEVLKAESDIPILSFENAGDYGWGFAITRGGKVLSRFELSYMAEDQDLVELTERDYPGEEPSELLYMSENSSKIYAEMLGKLRAVYPLRQRIEKWLAPFSADAFREFDLSEEQVERIGRLLNADHLTQVWEKEVLKIVEQFKEIVGIEEMNWISPDYEDEDED